MLRLRPMGAVALLPLAPLAGCADVWGFTDLQAGDASSLDAASVDASSAAPQDGQATADGSSSDVERPDSNPVDAAAPASDAGTCLISNLASCRGRCADPGLPCGCVPEYATHTSSCVSVGMSGQGNGCGVDDDCAPGYGCDPNSTPTNCEHWCNSATVCPNATTCHMNAPVLVNNEYFGRCY